MSPAPGATRPATAVQLLVAAERLFAEHGFDGVSLRQIAAAAGSANMSAVHYHFGSKEGLVEAILGYRIPDLLQRRALLKKRSNPDDLWERLEAHLMPLFDLAEAPDNSYVSFLEQLQRTRTSRFVMEHHPEAIRSQQEFVADIRELLPDIAEPVRTIRIHQVQSFSLHAAAEREQAVRAGGELTPFGLFVAMVVDGFAAYLAGPTSSQTQGFVRRHGPKKAPASVRLL